MSSRAFIQRIRRTPQPSTPALACSKLAICVLPVAQIAIGAVYLEDCPLQHYIPIYLIVVGVFGLALAVLSCLPCAQSPERGPLDGPSTPLGRVCAAWSLLTSLFLFCWFIAGNVWIYSIYEPNYIRNSTNAEPYCDKTVYLFAFWTTTLIYILLALSLVGGCCGLFCLCLCGQADPDDNI
ncbi:transmembrane protein 272-like isoform 1-T2 [Spinachia spinachia]